MEEEETTQRGERDCVAHDGQKNSLMPLMINSEIRWHIEFELVKCQLFGVSHCNETKWESAADMNKMTQSFRRPTSQRSN